VSSNAARNLLPTRRNCAAFERSIAISLGPGDCTLPVPSWVNVAREEAFLI
jgi:hypothetical protein